MRPARSYRTYADGGVWGRLISGLNGQSGGFACAGSPSSAVAARLKQQLPKLQSSLLARGWQVNSLRLKVQVTRAMPEQVQMRTLELPEKAVAAFEELGETLPDTPQNAALVAAVKRLAEKRRRG